MVAYVEDPDTHDTKIGDTNLDGDVDSSDVATCIIYRNLGLPSTHWSIGDLNGDGVTTQADVDLAGANQD